jgi:preprotein translocase subunit SecD
MTRRDKIFLTIISILFILALLVVLPINRGLLGKRGIRLGLDLQGGAHLIYQADFSQVEPGTGAEAIDDAIAVIEKRVNALGVSEPVIQRLGEDRIVVDLPGITEMEKAKKLIGQTAILEFGELIENGEGEAKWTDDLGNWKPTTAVVDGEEKELTSVYFKENTYVNTDNLGRVILVFEWDDTGSKLFEQITKRLMNKPLGIFLGNDPLLGEDGRPIAPTVRAVITNRGQIEGLSFKEATELSRLLNAGRIPVPLNLIREQTLSPILGSHFVSLSVKAGLIGLILVMLFMMIYYRLPGVVASGALIFYVSVVLAIFKTIPVTLTLAGIGGFVVSIGMAVDANVLIFERMKEELRLGRTLAAAVDAGFSRAWPAIRDSNVTTFIATGILYWLGSSVIASAPVMGFALTLTIGVAISMFTAITVTRAMLRTFIGTGLAQKTSLFSVYSGKGND